MKFKEYKIKEICDIKSGKRLPIGSDFSVEKTNYPYIRARDIKNGKINYSQLVYINEKTYTRIKKYIINEGDVAITIVANIGDVGYCEKKLDGVNLTENAVRLTNFIKNINSRYLTYYLSQPFVKEYMENLAAGAAQSKLGIYKIQRIKVVLPELEYQNNVVSTISKYDDLIEKNNRKIAILEEQIQELYKEWFVRFRFPGYEKVKFVNGLPQGWRVGSLLDIMVLLDSKRKPLSSIERDEKDKIYPYYGAAELIDYIDEYIFDGRYILMGEDGSVITKDGYPELQYVEGKFWVNNHAHVIIGKDEYHINFVYSLLKKLPVNDIVTGASQPKISQGRMLKKKILIPNIDCITDYCNVVNPIFEEIFLLKELVKKETNARDLLLSRLMSGKLKV